MGRTSILIYSFLVFLLSLFLFKVIFYALGLVFVFLIGSGLPLCKIALTKTAT